MERETRASAHGEATGADEERTVKHDLPGPGELVGRYVLLKQVGAGAMGVVFAGYDPELDRKVAIKLVGVRRNAAGDTEVRAARERVLREAQAMARLSEPNTVAVHDVGLHRGRVFIAMEFIDGVTLGEWFEDPSRPWHEVVDALLAAGRPAIVADCNNRADGRGRPPWNRRGPGILGERWQGSPEPRPRVGVQATLRR